MADRRSPGLTFGQLITLTFGFLLASVVIFIFGLWVGRDLADQQTAKQRDVARVAVDPPEPGPTKAAVAAVPPTRAPEVAPTRVPVAVAPTVTAARAATATAVMVVRLAATPTRPAATPAANSGWTVQAYATNDTVKAVMLARTLRSKGYDANTATRQIGGVTWYLVRVGRYRDRSAAKKMETKLRSEEGLEAASVTAQ